MILSSCIDDALTYFLLPLVARVPSQPTRLCSRPLATMSCSSGLCSCCSCPGAHSPISSCHEWKSHVFCSNGHCHSPKNRPMVFDEEKATTDNPFERGEKLNQFRRLPENMLWVRSRHIHSTMSFVSIAHAISQFAL